MPDTNELKTLQERILAGDVAAVPAFRKKLRADPAALENWARKPVAMLLAKVSGMMKAIAPGAPLLFSEGIKVTLDNLRSSLSGDAATPIEKLLIERIAATWLQLLEVDLVAVAREGSAFDVRRQDSAHRRFLSACKTLAVVRRLALPVKIDVSVAASVAAVVETENTTATLPERFTLPAGRN